jgi:energy-coupling factor transporter ATP-binding protein EcfA2
LSAGQRRRTALAVLVARDPELWLLDEPHAGLDAAHRELLDGLVRDAAGRGATVMIASHEHERASVLAGRVITMAGGQVAAAPAGPGLAGRDHPAEPAALDPTAGTAERSGAPVATFPSEPAHVA